MKGLEVLLIFKHGSPTPILIASVFSTSAVLGWWWGFKCGRWGARRCCCGISTLPTFSRSTLGSWEWVVVAVDGQHDSNFLFPVFLYFFQKRAFSSRLGCLLSFCSEEFLRKRWSMKVITPRWTKLPPSLVKERDGGLWGPTVPEDSQSSLNGFPSTCWDFGQAWA